MNVILLLHYDCHSTHNWYLRRSEKKCEVFLDIQSFDWVINYRLTIYNSQPTFSDFLHDGKMNKPNKPKSLLWSWFYCYVLRVTCQTNYRLQVEISWKLNFMFISYRKLQALEASKAFKYLPFEKEREKMSTVSASWR